MCRLLRTYSLLKKAKEGMKDEQLALLISETLRYLICKNPQYNIIVDESKNVISSINDSLDATATYQ